MHKWNNKFQNGIIKNKWLNKYLLVTTARFLTFLLPNVLQTYFNEKLLNIYMTHSKEIYLKKLTYII